MQGAYPPVIIKTEDKLNYFAALRQADAGIITPFIEYITVNLHHSLELMISGAKGEKIEEDGDLDKEIALLKQQFKSSGEKIDVVKNSMSIRLLIEHSINKLSLEFLKSSNRFKSFYVRTEFLLWVNDTHEELSKHGIKNNYHHSKLNNTCNKIKIESDFKFLNRTDLQGKSHSSYIKIIFNSVFYDVTTSDKKESFRKRYNEQLSDQEIRTLVEHEAKTHKNT